MKCEQAVGRMEAYLDGELDPEEMGLVAGHVEGCAGCADTFRFEGELVDDIRAKLERVELPPALAQRVLARLSSLAPRLHDPGHPGY